MSNSKWNIEKAKKWLLDQNSNLILLNEKWLTFNSKFNFKCKCGTEFERNWNNVYTKKMFCCNKCKNITLWNISKIKKWLKDNNLKTIILSKKYKNNESKLLFKCKCGEIFERNWSNLTQGKSFFCLNCSRKEANKKSRKQWEEILNIAKSKGFEIISKEEDYINLKSKIKYICKKHGIQEEEAKYITRFSGCKMCSNEDNSRRKTREGNPCWNENLTDEEREYKRNKSEYRFFSKLIFKRDNYTCQLCKKIGNKLNAHHLNSYDWYLEGRSDINNGVTLCKECHISFHRFYGYGNNTIEQFMEYKKIYLSDNNQYFLI